MSQQLATALRGEPAEDNLVVGPVVPVFVDASGRRRRWVIGLGWLVALACVAYLGVIGVSMTGTTVGPLPTLPSVSSSTVVFGSETEALPQGALESPFVAPVAEAAPVAAPARPAVSIAQPVRKAVPAQKAAPAQKAVSAQKAKTTRKATADSSAVRKVTSSMRTGGASR